jgi:hypothetical protein
MIADVRCSTSFTQSHGDEAAARLAATFAEIAKEGVEARGGEVIELRGDEALAVFTSARQALRAAVDLQLVFAEEYGRHPAKPLRVGIGVDAGEAVPVERGYRGGALNLADRSSAIATRARRTQPWPRRSRITGARRSIRSISGSIGSSTARGPGSTRDSGSSRSTVMRSSGRSAAGNAHRDRLTPRASMCSACGGRGAAGASAALCC